ncbi:PQQ-binding-like beta-propeller repeat protein, partial [Streptomyces sp. NPDC003077]|uniref:outer membrane protein assembly factor BamB family protein n=1 Tax=Streptomyces sp. NPDC003077 TaxID=3154443 RepID=UPI0033BDD950
ARRAEDPRGPARPPRPAPGTGPIAPATASAPEPAPAVQAASGAVSHAPVAPPPPPPAPPMAPHPAEAEGTGPDGPVRLAGSSAAIGPGPRAADGRETPPSAQAAPATDWVRPPGAGPSVPPQATAGESQGPAHARADAGAAEPPVGVTAPPPTGQALGQDAAPGRWRPWRFRMSNDVWGTPVVSGDLVYVTSFEVHALDVASGRRRFKTREVAWSMAVADGLVHASDGPSLYALDATDGTERWRLSTEGWVYALTVERNTVVTGTRGGGAQAWEATTGAPLWDVTGVQSDFETAESGPVLHEGTVFLWADGRLKALEARTGAERWSYPVGDAAACGGVPMRLLPAPDGAVYVTAGTRVLALDIARGDLRWQFEAPAVFLAPPAYAPGPAVTGGGVYLADYLGTVYALDAADGRDRWRIATEARQSAEPVLVVDGAVHLGSGKALYTLDAVTGTPRWRFQAGGEVVGAPVVADGRVHFGSADHCLYTLDAMGGQLRWKLATGGEITGTPVAVAGVVYACSKDRCVYALDAEKGTGLPRRS